MLSSHLRSKVNLEAAIAIVMDLGGKSFAVRGVNHDFNVTRRAWHVGQSERGLSTHSSGCQGLSGDQDPVGIGVDLGNERSARDAILVEGDVDHVISGFQGHKTDRKFGRTLKKWA